LEKRKRNVLIVIYLGKNIEISEYITGGIIMNVFNSITELIGNTPLVRLNKFPKSCNIFVKCEFMNPYSVKDRPVLNIILEAEKKGKIKPGSTLIEATSGNTGMAIAFIAAIRGYKVILCMSEIQSIERRQVLKALGAELVLTPKELGTKGARERMLQILEENPDYFYVAQHFNLDNPGMHYRTTGPELWRDTDGEIDILVAGLGTGGTICGSGKFLKEKKPELKTVAVEPENAPFVAKGIWNMHKIMGISPGFIPDTLSKEYIDEIELVSEEDAFAMCRRLAREEGFLVGISSGSVAVTLERLANKPENAGKTIVGIFPDSGERYLSVEGLFDVS
jgi:cysteine synthase A